MHMHYGLGKRGPKAKHAGEDIRPRTTVEIRGSSLKGPFELLVS
jgi:hypothetical protein